MNTFLQLITGMGTGSLVALVGVVAGIIALWCFDRLRYLIVGIPVLVLGGLYSRIYSMGGLNVCLNALYGTAIGCMIAIAGLLIISGVFYLLVKIHPLVAMLLPLAGIFSIIYWAGGAASCLSTFVGLVLGTVLLLGFYRVVELFE